MKNTDLEITKNLQLLYNAIGIAIYSYISALIMSIAAVHISETYPGSTLSYIFLGIAIVIFTISLWYMLIVAWRAISLEDYDGTQYFISNFLRTSKKEKLLYFSVCVICLIVAILFL